MARSMIRFETFNKNCWLAMSGEVQIGMIVLRPNGDYVWIVDGVRLFPGLKIRSTTRSFDQAKRSIRARFADWCAAAGLAA